MKKIRTFAFERRENRRQIVLTPCIGIIIGTDCRFRIAIAWIYWKFYIKIGKQGDL